MSNIVTQAPADHALALSPGFSWTSPAIPRSSWCPPHDVSVCVWNEARWGVRVTPPIPFVMTQAPATLRDGPARAEHGRDRSQSRSHRSAGYGLGQAEPSERESDGYRTARHCSYRCHRSLCRPEVVGSIPTCSTSSAGAWAPRGSGALPSLSGLCAEPGADGGTEAGGSSHGLVHRGQVSSIVIPVEWI